MALTGVTSHQLKWHRTSLLVFYGFFLCITVTAIVVGFSDLAVEEQIAEVNSRVRS